MSNKPIHINKAKRKAFDKKELACSLIETMSAEQLSIYLGEPVTDEVPLHELFGDDYIHRTFEMFIEKRGADLTRYSEDIKKEIFDNYKQAFLDGVNAHANGNYY